LLTVFVNATTRAKFGRGHLEGPAALAGAGGGQAGDGAFGDEFSFELGQGSEDAEDQVPGGGGGVDGRTLAGEYFQPDTAGRQVMDGVDQVVQVPAEPVEFPHNQPITLPQAFKQEVSPGRSSVRPEAWSS